MSLRILASAICGAFLVACAAGPPDAAPVTIRLSSPSLDFGRLPRGLVGRASVGVRYEGGPAELSVKAVRTGSSAVRVPGPVALRRGVETAVEIVFDASNAEGLQKASNSFQADAAAAVLAVAGEAVSPALDVAVPAQLPLAVGAERTFTAVVTNLTDATLALSFETATEAHLVVTHPPSRPAPLAKGESRAMSFDARCESPGDGRAELAIHVEGCASCEVVPLVAIARCATAPALVPATDGLDFGSVSPGGAVSRKLAVTNPSELALGTVHLAIAADADGSFSLPSSTVELGAGSEADIEVRFAPARVRDARATLEATAADGTPLASVALRGHGGGPDFRLVPASLDFGLVAVGEHATRTATFTNTGDEPLVLASATSEGPFSLSNALPATIAPGASFTLAFEALAGTAGAATGTVTLATNDADAPSVVVPLALEAVDSRGCALSPAGEARLDFGHLATAHATLPMVVRNTGTTACLLEPEHLPAVPPEPFHLVEPRKRLVLAPGATRIALVTADGAQDAPHLSTLHLEAVGGAPALDFPLSVDAVGRCLLATPSPLRFPAVPTGCGPVSRSVFLTNTCGHSLPDVVANVRIEQVPGVSLALASIAPPDGRSPVEVTFAASASEAGPHASVAELTLTDRRSVSIGLEIPAETRAIRTITFPPPPARVDVLVVADDTSSLAAPHVLADAIGGLLRGLSAGSTDYRVAVARMSDRPLGRLSAMTTGARVLDRSSGTAAPELEPLVPQTIYDAGLETLRSVLDPNNAANAGVAFPRADARLVVVVLSDEADESPGPVSGYVEAVRAAKPVGGVDVFVASPDVADADGRYRALATAVGGEWMNLASLDWNAAMARAAARAELPRTTFGLDGPADPASIEVELDGTRLAATAWHYEAARAAIVLDRTAVGASLTVRYAPACF